MKVNKGLQGMKPMNPSITGRNIYDQVPEADLDAKLEHMKQIPKETPAPHALEGATPLSAGAKPLGLRVDVSTHEGFRDGLPKLLEALRSHGVRATIYLAFGPDRSGLVAASLLRSPFRKATSWRTILSGRLLPAQPTAPAFPELCRRVAEEGHQPGVLGWDTRLWESRLNEKAPDWAASEMERGFDAFAAFFASKPKTFAAPGWICHNESLIYQENLNLEFASDCRGMDPFLPVVDIRVLKTPQVPVTLPTLEESVAAGLHSNANGHYEAALAAPAQGSWPVLQVTAETDGRLFAQEFAGFLANAKERGVTLLPLRELLAHREAQPKPLPRCTLSYAAVDGRVPVVTMQMFEV